MSIASIASARAPTLCSHCHALLSPANGCDTKLLTLVLSALPHSLSSPSPLQVVDHVHFHFIPKPDQEQGLGVGWPATKPDKEELQKVSAATDARKKHASRPGTDVDRSTPPNSPLASLPRSPFHPMPFLPLFLPLSCTRRSSKSSNHVARRKPWNLIASFCFHCYAIHVIAG